MLREEQVAELLTRVERIFGKQLSQVRGNLRVPENRAAAVWELLVIEAASYLGQIEYEPEPGGSPDIKLRLPQGRDIWIEAAYLYPRFWEEERQSNEVVLWLRREARRRGIPGWKIHPQLNGMKGNEAGPVRVLPKVNERKKFLKEPEIAKFFDDIVSKPTERHACTSSSYTLSVFYSPNAQGPYATSGGLQQEAPKVVEEHNVYRALRDKAGKQYDVVGPIVVCLGSDQSPALSSLVTPGNPRVRDAVSAALRQFHSIAAVIIVSIETKPTGLGQLEERARGEIFENPYVDNPLSQDEVGHLSTMNFNRWKYTFKLEKWGKPGSTGFRRASGSLTCRPRGNGMEIEVPTNVVMEALAGMTNLFKAFRLDGKDAVSRALNEGWVIDDCSLKPGNIEAGEAAKVVLSLSPPLLPGLLDTKRKRNSKWFMNCKKENPHMAIYKGRGLK